MTTADYLKNIHGKTASLFMAACRIGATESKSDEETVKTLVRFGECLGIMFQFRDDLLDFTSDITTMGKEVHKDFRDGIYTMPVLCALEQPGGREALLPIMRENARRTLSDSEILRMVQTVTELGGVEITRREMAQYQQEAEKLLSSLCDGRYVLGFAAVQAMRALLKKLEGV